MSHRRRSLILFGPSKTGKTSYARSLGPHIYFGSQFSGAIALDGIHDAQYAVFDDWKGGFNGLPGYKDWFGAQWDVSVKRLHYDPVMVRWGRPIIWICNKDPRYLMSRESETVDWDWMEENVFFVEVTDKLFTFHANTE